MKLEINWKKSWKWKQKKVKRSNFSQTISFFLNGSYYLHVLSGKNKLFQGSGSFIPHKYFLRLIPCYCKNPSIFSRLGAWQFLADMPFRSVSSKTLWKLFLSLHLDASKLDSVETIQRENAYKDNWREILKSMFNNRIDGLWPTALQARFQALPFRFWKRVGRSSQNYFFSWR